MSNHTKRLRRVATLRWVPLVQVRVNPLAQRDLKLSRVRELVRDFDPEQFGSPTVSSRGEYFNVLDGHHRIEALKEWFGEGSWEDQQVQCWCYDGLSDDEEAEVFLRLNNTLAVTSLAKFRVGVTAGRAAESEVDRVVRKVGLRVAADRTDSSVQAVSTLMRVYRRSGASTLERTLRVICESYGAPGLTAPVIDGIGLLIQRYDGTVDDDRLVLRLRTSRGGVNALLGKAEDLHRRTRSPKAHCVAASAVEINNTGRGGKKLASWWRYDDDL